MLDPCQHPDFDRSSPLPPMPQISDTSRLALQAFIDYCLPHCRIATPPRLVSMLDRYVSSPTALSPDQTALLFMCLACGYVRYQYFGEHGRVAKTVRDEQREDIAWYRHAVDILTRWGSATFTSLRRYNSFRSSAQSVPLNPIGRCAIGHVVLHSNDCQPARIPNGLRMDGHAGQGIGIASRTDGASYPFVSHGSSRRYLVSHFVRSWVSRLYHLSKKPRIGFCFCSDLTQVYCRPRRSTSSDQARRIRYRHIRLAQSAR